MQNPDVPAVPMIDPAIVERVLLHGDLKPLSPAQKLSYYKAVCESLHLNPLTKPFAFLHLNGQEQLYALRSCTDQLRALHSVSITIMAREVVEDCYVVTARAAMPGGRQDESIGAVAIGNLKGEFRANAYMKAETKAKRRATLSIIGLSALDESEIGSIPDATPIDFDPATGEVKDDPPKHDTRKISPDMQKRLFATALGRGWSKVQMQAVLRDLGIQRSADIERGSYDRIVAAFEQAPPLPPEEQAF